MIIDAHVHARGSVHPEDQRDTISGLIHTMDETGITKAVVVGLQPSDNELIFEAVSHHPNRLIPFVIATPEQENPAAVIAEAVTLANVRGIGEIYPRFGPAQLPESYLSEILQAARDHKLPILFHTGDYSYTAPLMLMEIIKSCRDINFILGHMGSLNFALDAIELASMFPNVYLDTSGMSSPSMLGKAVQDCGPQKIFFASDYPYWHPKVEITRIEALALDSPIKQMILGENIAQLLLP